MILWIIYPSSSSSTSSIGSIAEVLHFRHKSEVYSVLNVPLQGTASTECAQCNVIHNGSNFKRESFRATFSSDPAESSE